MSRFVALAMLAFVSLTGCAAAEPADVARTVYLVPDHIVTASSKSPVI
jgi:hypothetical protein